MAKTMISIRLDTTLLEWFKDQAVDAGYQSKISAVLEDFRLQFLLREQKILGQVQQIFLQYHARCFWHLRRDLDITLANIPMVQGGLRKYGGLEGMRLAATIDPSKSWELTDATD